MAEVLLINPPPLRSGGSKLEHLGIGYLASSLRKAGVDVDIIDAPSNDLGYPELTAEIKRRNCKLLGVSVLFQENLLTVVRWLEGLKETGFGAHITIGGHPATFTYGEILTRHAAVDSVVRGEGEITLVELADKVCAGQDWRTVKGIAFFRDGEAVANSPRPLIAALDDLPWPSRDVLAANPGAFEQLAAVSSRGCHCFCSFCSIATFYRGFKGAVWRGRNPEDVLDEIDAARKIHPYPFVMLFDDCFIGPGRVGKERAFEFAEALVKRRPDYFLATSCRSDQVDEALFGLLKKGRLRKVFLGVESGNDTTLALYDKRSSVEVNRKAIGILNKLGLVVETGFIMFNPYTTFEAIRADLDFLLETGCGPDAGNCGSLGLFPGQPILDRLRKDGLLRGDPFNYEWVFKDPSVDNFFAAIRRGLLDARSYPALRRAHMLDQALRIGAMSVPEDKAAQARSVIKRFHEVVYTTLVQGSGLFQTGLGRPAEVEAVKREFHDGCREIEETATGL